MIQRAVILAALLFFPTAAHATGPACCGGGGSSISANSCSVPGDFATGIATDGTLTCSTPSGGGNVSNTGTPVDNQLAIWTAATTIEGDSALTFDTSTNTLTTTTFSGALSGNATTATALASNPSDCASDTYATTIAASGNLTCASITNASTTGTAVNTPSTLVLRDGSGNFAAGTITAALTGNASTATALAANPADCSADTYATTIAASGALTCSTVTNAGLAGSIAVSKTLLSAGFGLDLSGNSLLVNGAEWTGPQVWGDGSGTMSWTFNTGITDPIIDFYNTGVVDVTGTLEVGGVAVLLDGTGTVDVTNLASDSVTEAKLKAVDSPGDEECLTYESTGGDFEWQSCGSGSGISGIAADSGGTTTGSTVTLAGGAGVTTTRSSDTVTVATASTEQDFLAQSASLSCAGTTPGKLIVDTTTQTLSYCPTGSTTTQYAALGNDSGQATLLSSVSCSAGVITASDGTPSCLTASSTPEFVSRVMTAGGTLGNYAVVMADGSDDDEVIEATTSTTQILGCSQDSDGTTSTNPVEVAVAGIARCKADSTVTAGSLVKLGATGEFALATTAEKTWGRAVTDDDGAGSAYILLFDGAEGTIDHALDLWTSIPDLTSNTLSIINANPTVSMTSTGTLNGVNFAPAFTTSGIGTLAGFNFQPTYSHSSLVSQLYGFNMVGTYTSTDASAAMVASIMRNSATYTSSTANAEPFSSLIAVDDKPVISNTTATTSTSTPTSYITIRHDPVISINDADGATGGLAAMTLTNDIGLTMSGTYTETSGTLAVTNRVGFQYNEVTNTSSATAITNNIGVDIAALGAAGATTNIGIRNADTTVYTPTPQAIAAAATTISPAATVVCLTADANYDISNNPQISDGVDGQLLTLINCDSSTQTIELDDGDGLQLMGDNSVVLSAGDAISFVYTTAGGTADWYEISRTDAQPAVIADLPAAGCNASTASSFWDLPSSNAPAAACYGTNYPRGVLDFDATTDETAYTSVMLPPVWTGSLYADIYWFATATTNETQWGVQVVCAGSSEPSDPAFNTVSTVSTTVDGTTTDVTKSTVTVATTTDCSAGEIMHVKLYRDADAGGGVDDMTGDARLLRVVLRQ